MNKALVFLLAIMTALATQSFAADITLAPPSDVVTADVPDDVGNQILVSWTGSPD